MTHTNNHPLASQPQQNIQCSGITVHVAGKLCVLGNARDGRAATEGYIQADPAGSTVDCSHTRWSRELEGITGVLQIWGTSQSSTVGMVASTIAELCPAVADKLQAHRKYEINDIVGIKSWWFLYCIERKSMHLSDLEQGCDCVLFQTQWKLEKCFKVVEAAYHGVEISESEQLSSLTVVASTSNSSVPTATTSN